MASPSILKTLGDKASEYWSGMKSILPDENEAQALGEKSGQINSLSTPASIPNVDIDGNVTHSTPSLTGPKTVEAPQREQAVEPAPAAKTGMKPIIPESLKTPLPLYDDGGDVEADGKHQLAVLEDGEKVLTPEQAEAYRAEHGEKGAPASFGGRVISNPKGLKPMADTYAQERVDEPTKDAKMSIDNAPLTAPAGDTSNPPTADMGGAQPKEASTKELKPYSEVMSDRAKAKDTVNNPGVQPISSDSTETEVKPRGGTPEEQKAVDTDIRNAMGQGVAGLTKLGLAKIHDNALPQSKPEDKAADESDQPAASGPGMKPIGGAPAPELDNKARVADYNKRIQAALDKGTPEGQEEADRLALAKQEFIHSTPWGTPGNHPGFLGKLGHVAEHVAARLPIIGQVMGAIPGTEASRNAEHNATLAQTKSDTPLTTARESEENAAEKNAQSKLPKLHELAGGAVDPNNPDAGRQQALYDDINGNLQYKGPAANVDKPVSGQANKDAFQKVLAKIGTPEAADPGKQMEAITAAHTAKKISDQEYNESIGYLGANPAPATQMAASGEKADAAALAKRAGKWFTWKDDEGMHYGTGDKVPKDAEPVEVDGKTFMNEARAGNIVQKSLNQIAKDVDDHAEVFDNAAARNILATTLEQVDRSSAGLLIAGTGGTIPLPSGVGDMINTALQNNALDKKTAKAVKDYIADYKSMKDKVIVMQMEMQGGKIGRGSAQAFKAIADQLPNGATPDADTAKRQMKNLFTTQSDLMQKYPDRYQNYEREKPYESKQAEAEPKQKEPTALPAGVPSGATHVYRDAQNNIVGYALNGQYHALTK